MISFDHVKLAKERQAFVMPMGSIRFVTEVLREAGIVFTCSLAGYDGLIPPADVEDWDRLRDRCSRALGCGDLSRSASLVAISARMPVDVMAERVRTLYVDPLDSDMQAYRRALLACEFDPLHTPRAVRVADWELCRGEALRQCRGDISAWLERADPQQIHVFSTLLTKPLWG